MSSDELIWKLIDAAHYDEARIQLESRRQQWRDGDWRDAGHLGFVYLCLRRYKDAASAYELANRMAAAADREHEGPYLEYLGGAYWLSGEKHQGLSAWLRLVEGIETKRIKYADISGGIKGGLLLWYGAVSTSSLDLVAKAEGYLKKRQTHRFADMMPGPLAHCALGKMDIHDVIKQQWGDVSLESLIRRSSDDTLLCRKLCEVLLCAATLERKKANKEDSQRYMGLCAKLKNPHVEIEWYLARGETELN